MTGPLPGLRMPGGSPLPDRRGALVRFLLRVGESRATATAILAELYGSGRCELWPDSLSYTTIDLEHVVGHRQVTGAYLAALAASRAFRLVTFDRALAQSLPEHVVLIP
jgi:uncharacterized protein